MECCTVSKLLNLVFADVGGNSQNSVGHVVLFNRRDNQFQLSTNAHALENGVQHTPTNGGLCPTCQRPLHEESTEHSPAFMDSEYFKLLSSHSSDLPDVGEDLPSEETIRGDKSDPVEERPAGSLPRSAFNQGYFEQCAPFKDTANNIQVLRYSVRVRKRRTRGRPQSNPCSRRHSSRRLRCETSTAHDE